MSTIVLCVCIAVLVPAIDQLTKYLVRFFMTPGDQISVLGEFFKLSYTINDGAAFGKMGGNWRWVFMIATPIMLALLVVYLVKNIKTIDKLSAAALSLIFGGGVSNMIDRIFFTNLTDPPTKLFDGRVIDFLDFNITVFGHRIWSYIFNVADACVVVGVFLFLIAVIVETVSESNKAKKERRAAAPIGENVVTTVYRPGEALKSAEHGDASAPNADGASVGEEAGGGSPASGEEPAPDGEADKKTAGEEQ